MKLRWKILIGFGVFLLLAALSAWFTANREPASEVSNYLDSLRARGEKLEIAEVAPPSVPAADNCVDAVQMAYGSLGSTEVMEPFAMRMVAPGKAMAAWRQPLMPGYNDSGGREATNTWEDLAADVESRQAALDLLKDVFDRPKLDFNLDYKKGASMVLSPLAQLKRSAQALSAAAVLDLHNNDTGGAVTNICTMLALVRANHDEAVLISHLVRVAITAIAVPPTWEFLQATNVTDAQLAWLQTNWEQMEFIDSAERACEMERAMFRINLEKARADGTEFDRMTGGPSGSGWSSSGGWSGDLDVIKYQVGKTVWRASWSYTEEVHFLQSDQILLETLRAMETNSAFLKSQFNALQTKVSALGLTNVGAAFFKAMNIPDFRDEFAGNWMVSIALKIMRIEAERRLVVAAIALKRYQVKHGVWPQTLGELAPEFLASAPIDPYDGKPLRYHPNADGTYLLYCVGEDGIDDGGDCGSLGSKSSWQFMRSRDWVWPQPASDAEIQYFYDHQPK